LSRAFSRRREIVAGVFRYAALAATLFGLAMLIVFFVTLSVDVVRWFQVMPSLVQEHNAELRATVAGARDRESSLAEEIRKIEEEMAEALKGAADDKEREELRTEYETHVFPRARADQEITRQELLRAEKGIREDTSAPALLGHFFTHGPSNQPQDAGIRHALLGSLYIVVVTMLFAVPLGVGAAIYLEEYSTRNRLAHIIQVNINNLAGVPSVMYGVLGAFVFVDLFFRHLESERIAARNVLGGGLTIALLTLPIIIVAAQEALRAVPPSLRHGAHALGATRWQVVWRVVLPPALPGMLTGMILAISRAMGEAAPLLLFGALLYVDHDPHLFSRFTILPMQIFGWSDRPADEWRYNAALASAILVIVLLLLNAAAIYLRQRFQRGMKW
jgi:phosphate transport system permease protein